MHANPNSQRKHLEATGDVKGSGSGSSTPRNPKTHWRTQRKHAKQPMWEKEKVCSNPIPA